MAARKPRAGKAPAYQWYPGDALADEAMTTMSLEEEGAFRRLLDHHYREKSIPADPEELRRLCKWVSPRRFSQIWERVGKCFVLKPGDPRRLVNSRAEEQRKALDDFSEVAATGGLQAAENMTAEERSERARKAAKAKHLAANEKAEGKQDSANGLLAPANTASSSASASSSGSIEPERAAGAASPRQAARQVKPKADRAAYVHPELGKPENAKQRKVVDAHLTAARQVLDAVNAGRKRVRDGSRGIGASYTSLAEIAGRLDAGRTVEECLHVVAICEAESRANADKSFPYFNTVSPFIAKNFERLAARDLESAGRAPEMPRDRFQRPDPPRVIPPLFEARPAPQSPDDPAERRRQREQLQSEALAEGKGAA